MAGRPLKVSLKKILEGIENTGGIRTEICKRCNISRQTLYNYIERYPEIKTAIVEEEEKVLDMAEGSLFALIQNGDTSAIFYYLNNKGKARGYGQPYKTTIFAADEPEEKQKTGVLVTPGLLTEETWEQATKSVSAPANAEAAQPSPNPEKAPQ